MKKAFSLILVLLCCVSVLFASGRKEEQTASEPAVTSLNIAVLKGPTGMGMSKLMADSDKGLTGTNDYGFLIAGSADEVTAKLINGEIDFAAVPANLAAVLNKKTGGEIEVVAINTLGVIYVVENGETINSVSDLAGKTICSAGKGSTPEYGLNYILDKSGVSSKVNVEYKSEHSECVALLATGAASAIVIPEPFVTTALSKVPGARIALDLTAEWEKLDSTGTMITGVIVGRKGFLEENAAAVSLFMDQYKASVEYVNNNIEDAAAIIGSYSIVDENIAKSAIPNCNIVFIEGEEMKNKLSSYLNVLFAQNPSSVGGSLPDASFYYSR